MVPEQCFRDRELWFSFWGATTRVAVPTESDERHLTYYFRDYVMGPAEICDVHLRLNARDGEAYLSAPPAERTVTGETRDGQRFELRGEQTISAPTPLPPFALAPLSQTFTTIHAAAATPPAEPGSAVVIHGPSTAGKSSLVVALARRGWGFLSDDTVPVDRLGRALPFTRPIGIRERTAMRLNIPRAEHPGAPRFRTGVGTTLSVHPRDLGWRIAAPARIRWVVTLQPSASFAVETLSPHHARIAFDIERHGHEAVRVIEEFCHG